MCVRHTTLATLGIIKVKASRPPALPSRRQWQLKELYGELEKLKNTEGTALNEIRAEVKKSIAHLHRAELAQENQRRSAVKRKKAFLITLLILQHYWKIQKVVQRNFSKLT